MNHLTVNHQIESLFECRITSYNVCYTKLLREYSAGAFWNALERAIYVFNVDNSGWKQLQKNGMAADLSWQRSAEGYQQLYEWTMARMGAG